MMQAHHQTIGLNFIYKAKKMQLKEDNLPTNDTPADSQQPQAVLPERKQEGYRWVVVGLMGLSQLLMGLASNAVIPLQHKMTQVYGVSEGRVSTSIILSFLVFSLANFPANHIIDTRGLRVSFLFGTALYTAGTLLYLLIDRSYSFVIAGTVLMGLGQPFLLNSPAKVAAFWFFPKNRALATAIMVGINILGVGVGFLVPALVVKEESLGQAAKSQINNLYWGYAIFSTICLLLNYFFMRPQPSVAPSESAEAEKVGFTLKAMKQLLKEKNMLLFLFAYCLSYGSFIAFASNCNFLIKPYGYTDVQIATNAVLLMLVGTCGAIAFSIYIKRTFNFRLALRSIAVASVAMLLLLCLWLNTVNGQLGTSLIISVLGFVLTPLVPVSYDLGCELAFPLGEAQVTGLLNGGALLWAFIASTSLASTVGFSNGRSSLLIMVILSLFILTGAILFFQVQITLKRHNYEQSRKTASPIKDQPETAPTSKEYITFPEEEIPSFA